MPKDLQNSLKQAEAEGGFCGKLHSKLFLPRYGSSRNHHILLVGLGPGEQALSPENLRLASVQVFQGLKGASIPQALLDLENLELEKKSEENVFQIFRALGEGLSLASYSFEDLKSKEPSQKKSRQKQKVSIYSGLPIAKPNRALKQGILLGEVTNLARWMGDMPGNLMNPAILAREAQRAGRGLPLKVTTWNKTRIEREKMGAFLGVARGSSADPRFLILEYRGAGANQKPICFVGKGLTFDSGGISLKPSASMEEMKYDMCGGATVIATLVGIARLGLKVNALGLVPASENMPGPSANKPGDVVRARNGKSIEVNNTDAEGRLILADALCYASEKKPAWICDAATLTGAMVVSLGNLFTGFFTNSEAMVEKVNQAAQVSGEKVWRMPLTEDHKKDMKGTYGDLSNISSNRGAGSSTAAAFLTNFVDEKIPYVHFDVAGTAWNAGNRLAYHPKKGATGSMVRTFIQMAMDQGGKSR